MVCHILLPLTNTFDKIEAAIFTRQSLVSEDFPFSQIYGAKTKAADQVEKVMF